MFSSAVFLSFLAGNEYACFVLMCLSKQKTIDSLRMEIWDPQIQLQELIGLDLVSVISWKIVLQLLRAKSFYKPRLRQGFVR